MTLLNLKIISHIKPGMGNTTKNHDISFLRLDVIHWSLENTCLFDFEAKSLRT